MHLRAFALVVTAAIGFSASSAHSPRWQFAQFYGQRCATPQGWCHMAQPGLVGGPCWCPSPYGPVGGQIVQ